MESPQPRRVFIRWRGGLTTSGSSRRKYAAVDRVFDVTGETEATQGIDRKADAVTLSDHQLIGRANVVSKIWKAIIVQGTDFRRDDWRRQRRADC